MICDTVLKCLAIHAFVCQYALSAKTCNLTSSSHHVSPQQGKQVVLKSAFPKAKMYYVENLDCVDSQ